MKGNKVLSLNELQIGGRNDTDCFYIMNQSGLNSFLYSLNGVGGGEFKMYNNAGSGMIKFVGGGVVTIGTHTTEASAMLLIHSTDKGFLPPRMTTTQKSAISSPATGLVVYDTTLNKLCVYTGAGWETVTSA